MSRYEWGKSLMAGYEDPGNVPVGCTPIHINLVARHGTRGPTKKRIKELEKLAKRLHEVAAQAGNTAPAWMRDWKSPWEGKKVGGDLLPIGEEEMYYLAQRYRNNYTEIFEDDYHPETYPIITTQVVINLCLS
jgi:multiple inositol-polyphosphate phosphatase/2,3-bisphosphoglycerate 3-phosphatase